MLLRTLDELTKLAYLCTITAHRMGLRSEELLSIATSRLTFGLILTASGVLALLSCCVLGVETSLFVRAAAWFGLFSAYVACIYGNFWLAQRTGVLRRHSYVVLTIGLQVMFALLIAGAATILIKKMPTAGMPFKEHLMLIVLRNVAVLLIFEFVLVNYVWVPTLTRYKDLHDIFQHKVTYLDDRGSFCIVRMFLAKIGRPAMNRWVTSK